jgi:hypothetical protein
MATGIGNGSWAATAASSELVAANNDRENVVLQLHSGSATALGFGEAAVFTDGLQLITVGGTITIKGHQARMAINGICDGGNTSTGGFQES